MKKFKNIIRGSLFTFLILVGVLAVHIYWVTRSRVDERTRVMARIDVNQPLSQTDATKIAAWLYHQRGVDHVLCNPKTEIVVFTFSPMVANGSEIAARFAVDLNYPAAKRFIPTASQLQGSCPMASTFSYKTYSYVRNFFNH